MFIDLSPVLLHQALVNESFVNGCIMMVLRGEVAFWAGPERGSPEEIDRNVLEEEGQ